MPGTGVGGSALVCFDPPYHVVVCCHLAPPLGVVALEGSPWPVAMDNRLATCPLEGPWSVYGVIHRPGSCEYYSFPLHNLGKQALEQTRK